LAANLVNGELAINITDGKLFYKDNSGVVQVLATKGAGTIGGSNTQVQYNNSGALAGSANLTFNGTTLTANTLNLTNALGTTYGGTGLSSFTSGGVVYASSSSVLATGSALTFDGTNFGGAVNVLVSDNKAIGFGSNAYWLGNSASGFIAGYISGSEQMRLTSTGLGIGTSSPGGRLEVVGASQILQRYTGSATGFSIGQYNASGDASINNGANANLLFATNNTERMRLDSSGNLGLGVTPSAWWSAYKVLEMGALGNSIGAVIAGSQIQVSANAFQYGPNTYKYGQTGYAATLYSQSNGSHSWLTAPSGTAGNAITFTQAMTLDASGNLLVGTTTQVLFAKQTLSYGSGSNGLAIDCVDNVNATDFAIFRANGAVCGAVSRIGTTSAVAYVTTSDYRAKENIAPMTGALAKVLKLKPVTYDWKSGGSSQGFIAHDLQAVVPDAVVGEKDAIDADGNPKYQGIDTSFLVATLTAAIQEQQAMIQSLTDRITQLENKL
jgi:hypothetical protein